MQNFQSLIETFFNEKLIIGSPDIEAKEYFGCNIEIKQLAVKYRKAKITPKKVGCFVALWKRDLDGKTIPYEASDLFDFYFIEVEDGVKKGVFLFPKLILIQNEILSFNKEGKRGFRLYPSWCESLNKQAIRTQNWQLPFFVNLDPNATDRLKQFKKIFNI